MNAEEKARGPKYVNLIVTTLALGGIVFAAVVAYTHYGGRKPPKGSQYSLESPSPPPIDTSALDVSGMVIPQEEVHAGGPPKDGIPALTDPKMISAGAADYLADDDRVIGITAGKKARAYPLRILNYHEIVNDQIAGTPVAVTYCPLCDSSAVFDRHSGDKVLEFGVSGLLYNSNVLMYDRGTDSLWSQMMTRGISGSAAKQPLKTLPMELTTWSDWSIRYPDTLVMSKETGHTREYDQSPYQFYFDSSDLMFPVDKKDDRLGAKTLVLGIWKGEKSAKAYPLSAFDEERTELIDELDGHTVVLRYNPDAQSLRVAEAPGDVQWVYAFWFAWYAFRPETELFSVSSGS